MVDTSPLKKKKISADWLVRGVLTKLGDTVDRFTGRRWIPTSSIAASELIERIKALLEAESKTVPGKGTVIPHNIKLKIQWDKFSDDADEALLKLRNELLTATIDHINDSLYYTYAPVVLEVKPDYFVEGVKLMVSYDKFADEDRDVEMNVTIPSIDVSHLIPKPAAPAATVDAYIARFELKGIKKEKRLEFLADGSISVGRTSTNALMLEDNSVSKIHASLSVDSEGRLSVADTGSTNGTFVNEERLSYGKATLLEEGDKVKFGTVEVEFEYIPRQVVIATDEPEAEEVDESGETMEIGGFEFKRRESPDLPAVEEEKAADEPAKESEKGSEHDLQETSPAIKMPSRVLTLEPIETERSKGKEPLSTDPPQPAVAEKPKTDVPSDDDDDDGPETRYK